MKPLGKIFFVLGITLGSIGLLYSFSILIALNGIGNVFDMVEAKDAEIRIVRDSINVNIFYQYKVNEKEYCDKYEMFVDYFEKCNISNVVVKYNSIFPMLSYIDGIPLKSRKQKTGIILSSIFLLFLIILWKFSNRDKWYKMHEEVGSRPWLYPEDTSITNPIKRFIMRLFKK